MDSKDFYIVKKNLFHINVLLLSSLFIIIPGKKCFTVSTKMLILNCNNISHYYCFYFVKNRTDPRLLNGGA